MNRLFAFLALLLTLPATAQPGKPLHRLLRHDMTAVLCQVLRAAAGHRVQLIYTRPESCCCIPWPSYPTCS